MWTTTGIEVDKGSFIAAGLKPEGKRQEGPSDVFSELASLSLLRLSAPGAQKERALDQNPVSQAHELPLALSEPGRLGGRS